jgi:hypothetical protein
MFLTRGACEKSAPITCLDFATEEALCSNRSNMGKKNHMLLLYPIWQSKSTSTNKNHVKKLIHLACVELCSLNLQAWNAPMNHEGEAKSALVMWHLGVWRQEDVNYLPQPLPYVFFPRLLHHVQ